MNSHQIVFYTFRWNIVYDVIDLGVDKYKTPEIVFVPVNDLLLINVNDSYCFIELETCLISRRLFGLYNWSLFATSDSISGITL